MNSIFYDVLKLKKAGKFKRYFNQHRYIDCFETHFLVQLYCHVGSPDMNPPPPSPLPLFITPYKVV